jgi:DnaJ-class molecular chaperone
MHAPTDHYATLGIPPDSSPEAIKAAFRQCAKAHHPDVNGGTPRAMARSQAINEAYRVLGDPARRAAYDRERDLHAAQSRTSPRTPPPVKQDLQLPLETFFRGTTLHIEVRDPGHPDGFESYPLEVPPETAPGTRFRIRRDAPFTGGVVEVRVKPRPDRFFKPKGRDLRYDLTITARRAESGGTETLRGPNGATFSVTIPAKVKRGEILRIKGEGLPTPRGGRGDLLVRVLYRLDVRVTRGTPDPAPRRTIPPRRRLA